MLIPLYEQPGQTLLHAGTWNFFSYKWWTIHKKKFYERREYEAVAEGTLSKKYLEENV